jgi:multimeric flavodoxin WrbA
MDVLHSLIVSGSERHSGVTANISELLAKIFEEQGCQSKVVHLSEHRMAPCGTCGHHGQTCNYRSVPCDINDDIPMIVDGLLAADIIVYACPVHAFGPSHLMQIFLERVGVGYLRFKRPLMNKVGGCVIVGRKYNLGNVHDQIINNMLLNRIIVPGAGFPVLIHGNEQTKSTSDAEELTSLYQLADRLVEVRRSIDYSKLPIARKNERELTAMTAHTGHQSVTQIDER